ncbi:MULTISPECIES: hypothetical protein [unclassified Bradyrhizobium]|uniref:hypothetical protein n=1 Tax=unclassified Bradyrhizobium TaxID=2631580 RepID=UPI00247A45CF|nr:MULTISPECIES: hypothetical protein [unclassified Bradyrhizobium]WGR68196.1 hypothetical protein MTX24_22385 [Bradyrhizobium sp. ISRA426]WGR80251.1 hypothetical protein MTX21_07500 [Bradyrhizobium sp. ISRA430]WGR83436.1 hypothetical protein MTX25_22065 [Bradyrhizobium sp. ISRA432]
MRIVHAVLVGAFAAAVLTVPSLARNSEAQKGEDKAATSTCSAYQQAPDGSWEQLPCKETGERGQAQTQHRTPAQGTDREER